MGHEAGPVINSVTTHLSQGKDTTMSKRHWPLALFMGILVLFVSACGNAAGTNTTSGAPDSFTIVYQPGLGAVNFVTLKIQKTLDKQFPHTTFQGKLVKSDAALRQAVPSNPG